MNNLIQFWGRWCHRTKALELQDQTHYKSSQMILASAARMWKDKREQIHQQHQDSRYWLFLEVACPNQQKTVELTLDNKISTENGIKTCLTIELTNNNGKSEFATNRHFDETSFN